MSTRGGRVLGTKKGKQQAAAFIVMRVEVPTVGFYGIASATQICPLGVDCLVGLRASSAGVSPIIHPHVQGCNTLLLAALQ
jgi:hypothetical protein